MAHWTRRPGIGLSDLRINLHTCKSNEKQLYFLKSLNSLQEGPVSNLQTRCVRADKGRKCVMLFFQYKIILPLIIAFMIVGGS